MHICWEVIFRAPVDEIQISCWLSAAWREWWEQYVRSWSYSDKLALFLGLTMSEEETLILSVYNAGSVSHWEIFSDILLFLISWRKIPYLRHYVKCHCYFIFLQRWLKFSLFLNLENPYNSRSLILASILLLLWFCIYLLGYFPTWEAVKDLILSKGVLE